jgi:hypothetical protein
MNHSLIEYENIKQIDIYQCDFVYALSSTYKKIMGCVSGDVVYIKNLNDFNIVNSLEKMLKHEGSMDDHNLGLVITVSIDNSIINGKLYLKEFILDALSSIRFTAYTKSNISTISRTHIINVLIKTLVSREVRFLIIKDMYKYASTKNSSSDLFDILRNIAISSGVIVIFDHSVFNSTNNINMLGE